MQKFFKKSCAVLAAVFMLSTTATLFSRAESVTKIGHIITRPLDKSSNERLEMVFFRDSKECKLYELTVTFEGDHKIIDMVKVTNEFDEELLGRGYINSYNLFIIFYVLRIHICDELKPNVEYAIFYFSDEDEVAKKGLTLCGLFTVSKTDKVNAEGKIKWQAKKFNPNFIPSACSSSSSAMSSTEPLALTCPPSASSSSTTITVPEEVILPTAPSVTLHLWKSK